AIKAKIAIDIIFDKRDAALRKKLDQPLLFVIGHAASQRVAEIGTEDGSFDAATLQPLLEFIQTDTMARESWNFAHFHPEGFDDLQDAEKSGRFDGNHISRFGHRAQTKIQCLSHSERRDDVVRG